MVAGLGWIHAADLTPGDQLVTAELAGENNSAAAPSARAGTVHLDAVDIEHLDDDHAVTVYNIHVRTHHTYYVLAGTSAVLVHNMGAHITEADLRAAEHARQLRRYGKGGCRILESGRVRYSGVLTPARTEGEMAGRRLVREWDPTTNQKRAWHETVDHNGRVRQVRILKNDSKVHYTFANDGSYRGRW